MFIDEVAILRLLNQRSFLSGFSVLVCSVSAEVGVIRHVYGAFHNVLRDYKHL
jgi:hypothetical protein